MDRARKHIERQLRQHVNDKDKMVSRDDPQEPQKESVSIGKEKPEVGTLNKYPMPDEFKFVS